MIVRMAHTSFTVSNLEVALDFFTDLLGLEASPVITVENETVQTVIGMPGARLLISNVMVPNGGVIELIQYEKPGGTAIDPATNNTGVAHIAFEVTDIESMVENLAAKGVIVVNPPVKDNTLGMKVCYLRGPDGITFELMEKEK